MNGFRLISACRNDTSIRLVTEKGTHDTSGNHFTIVIGRNGSGKSRLLSEICETFAAMDNEYGSPEFRASRNRASLGQPIQYVVDGQMITAQRRKRHTELEGVDWTRETRPSRVIATTITPFDKFPVPRSYPGEPRTLGIYRYLGSKLRAGLMSSTGQLSRVIESLVFATDKMAPARARLSGVFAMLGYKPKLKIDYRTRFSRRELERAKQMLADPSLRISDHDLTFYRPYSGRLQRTIREDPDTAAEIVRAMEELLSQSRRGTLTVDVDFVSHIHVNDLFIFYRDVQILRSYGLISVEALRIEKATSDGPLEIDLKEASSGEQSVALTLLGIASEIEDNSLIVIDEPEISLHPEWQEQFVPLLQSIFSSYRGCHFVLATHSPLLLSRVDPECSSIVFMDEDVTTDAHAYSRRSSDYQLATAFGTPGYRNEFLMREGLLALSLATQGKHQSDEFISRREILREARPHLLSDDPVAAIADAIEQAAAALK